MDEQACPRCKTTKYRNPNLKLLVNVCGHSLCENCVELLFVRGSGACAECGIALRRNNFRLQLFEDAFVEKEVDIRKRVLKDYNKKEEHFDGLRAYNDYLEEVETIVYNLANSIDVEDTKRKIELYKKENQDVIKRNRTKLSRDEELLEEMIEQEKHEMEFYRQQAREEDINKEKEKTKQKEALIDELMFSSLPADHILATHKREVEEQVASVEVEKKKARPTQFSSGIRMGKQDRFIPVPKEIGELYVYQPLHLATMGPDEPTEHEMESLGFMKHIRSATKQDKGGGFDTKFGCQRALQDAFCGLFFSPFDYHSGGQEGDHSLMDVS